MTFRHLITKYQECVTNKNIEFEKYIFLQKSQEMFGLCEIENSVATVDIFLDYMILYIHLQTSYPIANTALFVTNV